MKGIPISFKKMWMTALSVTLTILLSTHIKGPMIAMAAESLETDIPYEQIWLMDRKPGNTNVDYELIADAGSPQPAGTDRNGIYHFTLHGDVKDTLKLQIPYDSPGFYTYQAKAAEKQALGEKYIYPAQKYKITVLVTNANDNAGLTVSSITIETTTAEKSERTRFTVDIESPGRGGGGGGGGGGGSGGPTVIISGGEPHTPGEPIASAAEPAPTEAEEDPGVMGAVRSAVQTVAEAAQEVMGANRTQETAASQETTAALEPETTAAPLPEEEPETTAVPETESEVIVPSLEKPEPEEVWAIFNLICALITIITEATALVLVLKRKGEDVMDQGMDAIKADIEKAHEDDRKWELPKRWDERRNIRLAGLVPAAISAIVFFITEDLSRRMVMFDRYSVWMGLLFVVTLGLVIAGRAQDDSADAETEAAKAENQGQIPEG